MRTLSPVLPKGFSYGSFTNQRRLKTCVGVAADRPAGFGRFEFGVSADDGFRNLLCEENLVGDERVGLKRRG